FKLAIHYETRQLPLLALILANPGETGPQLRPHRDDSPCSSAPALENSGTSPAPPKAITGEFPIFCGDIEGMTSGPSGRLRVGARSVPIGLLADTLAQMGNLNRAVVDQTGLSG